MEAKLIMFLTTDNSIQHIGHIYFLFQFVPRVAEYVKVWCLFALDTDSCRCMVGCMVWQKRKVGGIRYEARSRGRSLPTPYVFPTVRFFSPFFGR